MKKLIQKIVAHSLFFFKHQWFRQTLMPFVLSFFSSNKKGKVGQPIGVVLLKQRGEIIYEPTNRC